MLGIGANVLVYAADSSEAGKHARCRGIVTSALEAGRVFIPAQALAEFVRVRTRKQGRSVEETLGFADAWRSASQVASHDDRDVVAAIETTRRHLVVFWDALIWAVCDRLGVPYLVTEDFQNGRRLGSATFLDPFDAANAARLGLSRP
jgi:predicted nucleic acid-binding protein